MNITFSSPLAAIIAAHAVNASVKKTVKHYEEQGCPGLMKAVSREHLEEALASHADLLVGLRAGGYPMTNEDIKPIDMDALFATPWKPPVHEPHSDLAS